MKMKNKLIVFDIDDTLYNEIDYVKSGYKVLSKYIEEKYHLDNIYNKLMELFQISSKNIFNRLFDELNVKYTSEEISFLVEMFRNHEPDIKLSQDIIETLNILKKNYKLAIVSDGNYNTQYLKCKSLNLNQYFDKIILTGKYGKDYEKPSRKAFDMLSDIFNVELKNMYYIGDNPNKDFYISKYGIKTIRYYNKQGIYYNDDYRNGICEDYRINKIDEIKLLIDSENK